MLRFLLVLIFVSTSLLWRSQETKENLVQFCNRKGHALCIKITAKEVFADGANGKWSHRWKRVSYIGGTCVEEHGKQSFRSCFRSRPLLRHVLGKRGWLDQIGGF